MHFFVASPLRSFNLNFYSMIFFYLNAINATNNLWIVHNVSKWFLTVIRIWPQDTEM